LQKVVTSTLIRLLRRAASCKTTTKRSHQRGEQDELLLDLLEKSLRNAE
jgi:hypothetical protein